MALRGHDLREPWLPDYPNLLADLVLTAPDQVWVADITYIRLPTTYVSLACVLDAYSMPTPAAVSAGSLRARWRPR